MERGGRWTLSGDGQQPHCHSLCLIVHMLLCRCEESSAVSKHLVISGGGEIKREEVVLDFSAEALFAKAAARRNRIQMCCDPLSTKIKKKKKDYLDTADYSTNPTLTTQAANYAPLPGWLTPTLRFKCSTGSSTHTGFQKPAQV